MSSDIEIMGKQIITVSVISYNSSRTIVETLDSVLNQSYGSKNIELVISDDASIDSTVEIVEHWLHAYQSHFSKVVFIKNKENGGVSKNCNLAWKAASSDWIKTIAADDILIENCLSIYVDYISKNNEAQVVFGRLQTFGLHHRIGVYPDKSRAKFFNLSANQQYNHIMRCGLGLAPTSFFSKEIISNVGYCEEKYKLLEDMPLWIKITKSGVRLYFVDAVTVKYRISDSLSHGSERLINLDYISCLERYYKDDLWLQMRGFNRLFVFDMKLDIFSWRFCAYVFNNKKNIISSAVKKLFLCFMFTSYYKMWVIIFGFLPSFFDTQDK